MTADHLREKRQAESIDTVTPVAAGVELVLIVDYEQWHRMSNQLPLEGVDNHTITVIIYYAHMVEIVSG